MEIFFFRIEMQSQQTLGFWWNFVIFKELQSHHRSFKVGTQRWIVHLAKMSKMSKIDLKTLQKCLEMVRKRSNNCPWPFLCIHCSWWLYNSNNLFQFSNDFAWDLALVQILVNFEATSKLFSMYLGTETEFFITIFLKVTVNHLIRTLVKFLMDFTR